MGKKRIAVLGETEKPKEKHKKSLKEEKGVRVPGLKGGERVVAVTAEPIPEEKPATQKAQKKTEAQKKVKPKKVRGKKYLSAKSKIESIKLYSIPEAIKLLKETSISQFDGSAEVHLVTTKTGFQGEAALPYFQSKTKKVEIANEETLKKIESGKIDFDILISTSAFMPHLLKYAKILGPKGLMPNPKNGTITDKPEDTIKKFQKTEVSFKTEKDAPLVHSVFGKVSQKENELEENLKTYLLAVGTKNIKKAVIKGTMGPGIKLDLTTL